MFWNNVKIAIRNLRKNKLFAFINVAGLALGMTIFVLAGLIGRYESTHDAFFANSDRIYTIGTKVSPDAGLGIPQINSAQSTIGPIIEAELEDVELVARTIPYQFLVSMEDRGFYEVIHFADRALLDIFDLTFMHGDESALESPTGVVVTESTAIKYFGRSDIVGEVLTFDNEFDFRVEAVIEDIPQNSHFNSMLVVDVDVAMFAPMAALQTTRDIAVEGRWDNLSTGHMTYVLLPEHLDGAWLEDQLAGIYERHVPDEYKEFVAGYYIDPLQHANLAIWDMMRMPVVTIIQFLGFLVLIIACVNYTNLATAQSLGRSREVGMRKTMGAGQRQLLVQFLTESLVIATIAMLIAITALEVIVPLFNNATNKVMALDYLGTLPWLVLTTVAVGVLAGAYPAWLITRASPIDALRESARKGRRGTAVRSVMIGIQFAISAFMLALVAIVFVQNEKVKESSYIFPKSEVYTIDRLSVESIRDRLDTLRIELEALPNVDSVGYSSQVPFEQNNSTWSVASKPGDAAGKVELHRLNVSQDFFATYDIPLLTGRNLDRNIANDNLGEESEIINVVVNELALDKFQLGTAQEALGKRIYHLDEERTIHEMIVVGVVPTQNILGLFNSEKPWLFFSEPSNYRIGSIRVSGGNMMDTVASIEEVWKRVIPDYPIQGRFVDDIFNDVYDVMKYMNMALGMFAFVALSLAMVGLFGLAAFMAAQRTKEIGVRKVLGASSAQIARLLVWQFSKPVMWALAVALPAAFFASNMYLDFFAERIDSPIAILAVAGAIAVMLAWGTVAGHAMNIARANPVLALRYE